MVQHSCLQVEDLSDQEENIAGAGSATGVDLATHSNGLPHSSCAEVVEVNFGVAENPENLSVFGYRRGIPSLVTNSSDCLPETAVVWAEGSIAAQSVGTLIPGQRVLCYDRLAENVCHDEVLMVKFASRTLDDNGNSDSTWVSVLLADGTEQELSWSHPVWPYELKDATRPILASDLSPGSHSLIVTTIMPVQVKSVTTVKRSACAKIGVRLQDHDRYEILVTQEMHTASTFVAVGSRHRLTGLAKNGSSSPRDRGRGLTAATGHKFGEVFMLREPCSHVLPASLFVWTEGSISAQPIGSLQRGRRLLCYDRFAAHICYAPVLDVEVESFDSGETWLSVSLADGTQQDFTASCCVAPKIQNCKTDSWEDSPVPTTVQSLQPGIDSLVVIKTKPVPVSRVTKIEGSRKLIAVSLSRPHRCDLLVSQEQGKISMLAVGSALHTVGDSVSSGFSSACTNSSYRSSPVTSSETSSEGSAEVILSGVTVRRPESTRGRLKETLWSHSISLRQINCMKQAGMGSLGTLAHASRCCNVCMFHVRYVAGHFSHPCKCGMLCDRCHSDEHLPQGQLRQNIESNG